MKLPTVKDDHLQEMIDEWNRQNPEGMTPEMRRAQAISFAYGNLALSGWTGTKEDMARIWDEMEAGKNKGAAG